MSACAKVSVSLSFETLTQMEYLRHAMRLNPSVKRSQLIAQIIFECYTTYLARENDDVDDKPSGFSLNDYFV